MAKLLQHSYFVKQKTKLKQVLERPGQGRFIFLIGPSGVGKTTMRRAVLRQMVGSPAHWGTGRIPVIEVFALLAQNAYFSSRSLAESLVHELFLPDLSWLRDEDDLDNPAYLQITKEVEASRLIWDKFPRRSMPERSSWDLFQRLAPQRSVWLASIDQAAALCTNHRNKDPADHILNLMSVVEKDRINFLFSGVHGAAALWAERPEVRRRSEIIWVAPYSHERKEDREPFLRLLRTLGHQYRFSTPTLLFNMAADLMAASAGIFGVLSKILMDAFQRASAAGHATIRKSDIEDSIFGDKDLKKMWHDVRRFEEAMRSGSTADLAAIVTKKWNLSDKQAKANGSENMANDPEAGAIGKIKTT
jgi:energy-coupling factor transporter ATP-binding protein EcfA2